MRWMPLFCLTLALATPDGLAQTPSGSIPAPAVLAERAGRRFPQPVRVGDLPGRKVLAPAESQPVLGHVARLVRRADGSTTLTIRLAGWLGIGGRSVDVPIEAIGLLGEHVALLDITPDQLRSLPDADPAVGTEIGRDDTIRVGLGKPFH